MATEFPPLPQNLTFSPGLETTVRQDPELYRRVTRMAQDVIVTVTPRTVSGITLKEARGRVTELGWRELRPDESAREAALHRLQQLGLRIVHVSRFAITIAGPAELISEVVRAPLVVQRQALPSPITATRELAANTLPPRPGELFLSPPDSLSLPSTVSEAIDHFVFVPPPLLHEPSSTPPAVSYGHLPLGSVPGVLRADSLVETGAGVTVGIVDSGFVHHPFYQGAPVREVPVPGGPALGTDVNGHGTAITANLLAVAPGVDAVFGALSPAPQDSLEAVAAAGAAVVSCSWGWNQEQAFPVVEATIAALVEEGVVILFASGNGSFSWPGSMKEVLSVGGVFADPADLTSLSASDFASGYVSSLYPPRRVPDVCGLCGSAPKGIYLPLPCPADSVIDRSLSGGSFPNGDETGGTDGWVYASGTSSATPQVAGVVALMLEKARSQGRVLSPAEIKAILERTAQPVQRGRNAFGFPAVGHPNVACGFGLVDAAAALALV